MTEAVETGAREPKQRVPQPHFPANGLQVRRLYTTPDVHPYDEAKLGAPRRRHDELA